MGKATAGKLEDAGITSVEALAEADPVELAKAIKTSVKRVKNWQISCNGTVTVESNSTAEGSSTVKGNCTVEDA